MKRPAECRDRNNSNKILLIRNAFLIWLSAFSCARLLFLMRWQYMTGFEAEPPVGGHIPVFIEPPKTGRHKYQQYGVAVQPLGYQQLEVLTLK